MPTDHEFISPSKNPVAVSSHRRKSSQETLSDRESISPGHQPIQRKDGTFFRFFDREEVARLGLEKQRDHHLLAEAKSEILQQECEIDLLNTSTREFQRQAHSNRLEMDYVNHGYERDFSRFTGFSKRSGTSMSTFTWVLIFHRTPADSRPLLAFLLPYFICRGRGNLSPWYVLFLLFLSHRDRSSTRNSLRPSVLNVSNISHTLSSLFL